LVEELVSHSDAESRGIPSSKEVTISHRVPPPHPTAPTPYTPGVPDEQRKDLIDGVIRALLWIAAFCFAAGIFLTATLILRDVPATPHVAVGRVTVENASKLRDYLTVLLFFIIAPAATIPLYRLGARENARFRAQVTGD